VKKRHKKHKKRDRGKERGRERKRERERERAQKETEMQDSTERDRTNRERGGEIKRDVPNQSIGVFSLPITLTPVTPQRGIGG